MPLADSGDNDDHSFLFFWGGGGARGRPFKFCAEQGSRDPLDAGIALSYYGSRYMDLVEKLREDKTPAIFYGYLEGISIPLRADSKKRSLGWVPWEKAAQFGLTNHIGRISFPDYYRGCALDVAWTPSGARRCDLAATTVYKLRRKDLAAAWRLIELFF